MQVHDDRSVTNQARRDQIVAAVVEVVAAEGYPAATYQRVARQAGLASTRTISYHFADKDELIAATAATLLRTVGAAVAARTAEHPDARSALAGYIRTAVGLNETHRTEMRALMRIFLDHRPADGSRPYAEGDEQTAVSRVAAILTEGQRSGVFRAFDSQVMAATVQRAVDGLPFVLEHAPDTDLQHYADELVALFDRATRA